MGKIVGPSRCTKPETSDAPGKVLSMQRFVLGIVGAFVLSVGLSAQVYMPQPVAAWLDAPAANATVSPSVIFGGWAFNWRTCRHVTSVQLWRLNVSTHELVHVPASVYWGPRPDVQAYAQGGGCPTAEEALGFAVVPHAAQPAGAWRYTLLISDLQQDPDSVNWKTEISRDVIVQ
jgi:hypothetical protein